jgi:multiple sugar transport system substrate-binding protein
VVSSFTTDNVGQFCSSGAFVDLSSFMEDSGIDPESTFTPAQLEYTQYQGNQCSLPLLGDAYGLYYNKDAFAAAGISQPPKTLSEFDADAVKLTKTSGDTYSQLGFMPTYHGYETTTTHFASLWGPKYFDDNGKSTIATDPAFPAMLKWQKGLVDALGGYEKLEKYRTSFGDEWGARNPFHTGQVAMSLDGEWRAGFIEDANVDFEYGVAPFPVPDDQADTYGKGYLSGTIIGIASTSKKQNAAWELVKYLTTDTDAVVSFANAIHNIPSTNEALESPDLVKNEAVETFIGIAQNPNSNTTPASSNGGAYQLTLQDVGFRYESGKETDLQAGLEKAAEQIDTDVEQAE